jgi:hypothetical protein
MQQHHINLMSALCQLSSIYRKAATQIYDITHTNAHVLVQFLLTLSQNIKYMCSKVQASCSTYSAKKSVEKVTVLLFFFY